LTVGKKAEELISLTNFASAKAVGALNYSLATTEAFIKHPMGGLLP